MMTHVRVVLDYLHPWPNSAGFFLARDRGWYAAAGLDVELRAHDQGWGDTLDYIARGQADFGVAPPNRLLVRRERGQPVVAVAAVNHEGLETVQVSRSSGISRPRELEGRRVGYAPTERGRAMVRTIVAADGGDADKVITVDTGHTELTPEFLHSGPVDATFGGYWVWDTITRSAVGEETLVWRMRDLDVPPYHSYILGTHAALIAEEPDLVRVFLEATESGFLAAASEQPATVRLLESVIPYVPSWRLARSLALVAGTWFHEGSWGVLRDDLISPYAHWLAHHAILAAPGSWREAATNGLLPPRDRPALMVDTGRTRTPG
jgi:ABC-type nitrate/sulfonate/bicarbonate transport system substrate-binding protein